MDATSGLDLAGPSEMPGPPIQIQPLIPSPLRVYLRVGISVCVCVCVQCDKDLWFQCRN